MNIFYFKRMFMKKTYLLLGLLILFSCEQNENLNVKNDSSANFAQTRAASSIADFDPIAELRDNKIPVNIINVGNTNNKYLSCAKSGSKVDLYNKDDGSGRQRWIFRVIGLTLSGGNSSFVSPTVGFISTYPVPNPPNQPKPEYPILSGTDNFTADHFFSPNKFVSVDSNSFNIVAGYSTGTFPNVTLFNTYMQSDSRTGSSLKYKTDNLTDLAQWKIVPVGEYEIVDMQYVQRSTDTMERDDQLMGREEYANYKSEDVTWHYKVSSSYSESSSFSQTEGVTVTISSGVSVGGPDLMKGFTVNSSISSTVTKSWTYGKSDSKQYSMERSVDIPVKSNSTTIVEAYMSSYNANIAYVATLRKVGDTKTFKVKGKWTGVKTIDFHCVTYDKSTGKPINTYTFKVN